MTWLGWVDTTSDRLSNISRDMKTRAEAFAKNPDVFTEGEGIIVIGTKEVGPIGPEEFIKGMAENVAERCQSTMQPIQNLRREMMLAQSDLANLSDVLEVDKADADLKAVIVNTWPRDVVGDRMTWLGTGLLGAGGAAYAIFGSPLNVTASLLPAAVLWVLGIGLLLWGFRSLARWQRRRWAFFSERFEIPD